MASCTQIDHQIQSYLDGELPHSDRAILEHHLAECPACVRALRQHQRSNASLFEVYAPVRLTRDLTEYVVSHLPEMEPLAGDMAQVNRRAKHPTPMRERLFRLMPIAAAALLLVLALLISRSWPDPALPADTIGVVAAAQGLVHRVEGDTGARSRARERVWVGPGDRIETAEESLAAFLVLGPTELRVAPGTVVTIDSERRLTLEKGRIFIDVARGQRLFKVMTPVGEATVFGTRFDVAADSQRTTVIVEEGKVQLSHRENPRVFRMILPDQRAYVEHGLDAVPVETVDARVECAWADAINPDPGVQELFAKRLQPGHETHQVPGEDGFFLQTNGKPLKALLVSWGDTNPLMQYSDYEVFVYAPDNTSVFRTRIPGATFSDPRVSEIELPNTSEIRRGYPTVFVKLVALSGPEAERVEFVSVSGHIASEGR